MGADYDRLFQPLAGGEIPDETADPGFDIDSGFDIDTPAAAPPVPASMPKPNGQAPPPMPVDWNDPPPPVRSETHRPPMPVDGAQPPPPPRPGPLHPPMPVDWNDQPRPARPENHRPPMPVDWNSQPPPARPKPPPPASPPQSQSRRVRRAPRDPAETQRGPKAPHSHRATAEQRRGKPGPPPPRPPADAPAPVRNGGPVHSAPPVPPARSVAAQRHSAPTPAPGDQHAPAAVSHIGMKPAKKSAPRMVSRQGWRRWVHKLTRINVGLSREEKYDLDLRHRIRRSPRGSYQIAILGLKGGVGKTTVTVTLGSVFSQVRRDRILAFDADASCGNLADRAGRQSDSTIADLLADKDLTHYNDIRAHTGANAVNLEVLPAEDYSTARRAFGEADWHHASDAVSRFYNLVLADCGAGLFDPVTRGVLSTASAAVIVTSASIDAARQAAVAIDWLRNNGHQDLLSRACVVINNVSPAETNIAIAELAGQFEQYVQSGRVIVLPWDKHIAAGTEIQLGLLDPGYKRRILELAAALSDDFDRSERR